MQATILPLVLFWLMVLLLLAGGVKDQPNVIPESTKQKPIFDLNRSPPPDESEDERSMPSLDNANSNEEITKIKVSLKRAKKRINWQKWFKALTPEQKRVHYRLKSQRHRSNIRMRVSSRSEEQQKLLRVKANESVKRWRSKKTAEQISEANKKYVKKYRQKQKSIRMNSNLSSPHEAE